MRIILSAAVSLDGCLDDCTARRLKLSGPEDWANVLAMRSRCDAILVGAGTVRADNPSLVLKDEKVGQWRRSIGMEQHLAKVTVTRSGNIDPASDFFTAGTGRKVVFASRETPAGRLEGLRRAAEVFVEDNITPDIITARLAACGYNTLIVEGGAGILGMFLGDGKADILRLAIAPFFVGERDAPRFVPPGNYPWNDRSRMELRGLDKMGDTSVMWLVPPSVARRDRERLALAVEQSRLSPPCDTAYRVGAVVFTADGREFRGYTHETGPSDHAEEAAIEKAESAGCSLTGAAIYSSMEPCTHRRSKPVSCTELIIGKGFAKAVYALAEPSVLASCEGHARLQAAGLEVVRDNTFDDGVRQINAHILG
ncbi:MAG: dihydrofolate reductase family protein [Rikenellaceae bacterium]|nr:dihydrofolate reductase family protein [Rikenellaceae bacterium]